MISKTIGFRGLAYFQTNPFRPKHIHRQVGNPENMGKYMIYTLHHAGNTLFYSVLEPSGLNFQSCQLQIFPRFMLGPGAHEVHQVRLAERQLSGFATALRGLDSFHLEGNVLFRVDGHWHRAPASATVDPMLNDFQLGSTGASNDSQNVSSIFRYHIIVSILSAYNIICLWNIYIYISAICS